MGIQTGHKEHNNFLELHSLANRDFYDYYLKHRAHKSEIIENSIRFSETVAGLLKSILRVAVKTNGGVDIEGFGYFCFVRSKSKRINVKEKNPLKKKVKSYKHKLYFYPEAIMKGWYLAPKSTSYKLLPHYVFTPESGKVTYEMEKYNRILHRKRKDIKFLT